MRILLWAPFGAGTHYWGPGTSAYRLYKNNKDKNVKITLVHASDSQGDFPDVYHEQIKIGSLSKSSLFSTISFLIKSYLWIRKNHRNYDVFHGITAYIYTFIPALIFSKFHKAAYVKITGMSGGFGVNGTMSRLMGFAAFRKKKANALSGYISLSTDISETLKLSGVESKRIFYIPNGVDTERFRPLDSDEKRSLRHTLGIRDVFTISYIGGLTKNKRVIDVVKALKKLIDEEYEMQFLIVGPDRSGGVVEDEIKTYISENNLQENCIRIDHTAQPETYFMVSDSFILNSRLEGLSNSLLEAMSCGVPCIASPASGTVDLIQDNVNGFLTDGSSVEIAERIKILYNDNNLCKSMSEQARLKIVKGYSVDHVLAEHLRLFKEGLAQF